MSHVGGVVDTFWGTLYGIEVLGKRSPRPSYPSFHRLGRDVLGSLKVAHDEQFIFLSARRERKPAVAHHHSRDAMPTGAGSEGIPEDLGIHMCMSVDDPGSDYVSFGVDDLASSISQPADADNLAFSNSQVGTKPRHPRTIDNRAVADD